MNGFFFIDKEEGMTSFEVVQEVRKITGIKKVGHAGTLDCLATGLLIVAVGEGTKLLEFLLGCGKTYEVIAKFGAVSSTGDRDGEITENERPAEWKSGELKKIIEKDFLGEIVQIPPKYSALKIAGRRASDRVRSGEKVVLKPRKIRIDGFEILENDWPLVKFAVKCSSGTYIRSLIADLGEKLSCGAYVAELRRISINDFSITEAVKLAELHERAGKCLVELEKIARKFPNKILTDGEFEVLRHGGLLKDNGNARAVYQMAFHSGKLVGILENFRDGLKFRKQIFDL